MFFRGALRAFPTLSENLFRWSRFPPTGFTGNWLPPFFGGAFEARLVPSPDNAPLELTFPVFFFLIPDWLVSALV